MIKACIIDFDGTLVTDDILSIACGIVGKEQQSAEINKDFWEGRRLGLSALIQRINFLHGVSFFQIQDKLQQNDYLRAGALELFSFLRKNNIITILCSGNITPILKYYQQKLGIDYIVGSQPKMQGDFIDSISEDDFSSPDFKLDGAKKILESLSIKPEEAAAIGDSPADKNIFLYIPNSIAIDPSSGIEKFAKKIIYNDLSQAIPLIQEWQ